MIGQMLGITPPQAYFIMLICVLPICFWVCLSDLRKMRIPNKANGLLMLVFLVVGGLTLPLDVWAWRWLNLPAVLFIGFILTSFAGVGAGDSKFAAAAAPFFDPAHLGFILPLFAACLLGTFAGHRIFRAIPAVRRATPDWASWGHKKFPMGLALVGTLVGYLLIRSFPSLYDALFAWTTM